MTFLRLLLDDEKFVTVRIWSYLLSSGGGIDVSLRFAVALVHSMHIIPQV